MILTYLFVAEKVRRIWEVVMCLISLLFNPYRYLDWSTNIISISEAIFIFIEFLTLSDFKIFFNYEILLSLRERRKKRMRRCF